MGIVGPKMLWLLAVMAHPGDESMGTGGLIVRHKRNDVTVHVICATRGELGAGRVRLSAAGKGATVSCLATKLRFRACGPVRKEAS